MRFYRMRSSQVGDGLRYIVTVKEPNQPPVEVEVGESVFRALADLQREFWRLNRMETRHSVHIENIPDEFIPREMHAKSPEQILVEQIEATEIRKALRKIPLVQQQRFLLRHLVGLSCRQIADMDGCSIRAVEQSLALARKNLRRILKDEP